MANRCVENLTIIDEVDLKGVNISASVNGLIARVPESIADTFDHYDLAEAIRQQFQLDIHIGLV